MRRLASIDLQSDTPYDCCARCLLLVGSLFDAIFYNEALREIIIIALHCLFSIVVHCLFLVLFLVPVENIFSGINISSIINDFWFQFPTTGTNGR